MSKATLMILVAAMSLVSAPAFAVDGVVLINQSTVLAAGGFPYKITQPGSYKLSGNLVVAAQNTDGIDILANNVTLDLNGFSITGQVTCTGVGAAIRCSLFAPSGGVGISAGAQNNLTVRNGSVTGFGEGVFILSGQGELVEEVHASGNADVGIAVQNAVARRNTVVANFGNGIVATNSVITENVASLNGAIGLRILSGVFGSNALESNVAPLLADTGAVSQNNNDCNGSPC